jgi:hypothetical protein
MDSDNTKKLSNAGKLPLHELVEDIIINDDDWRCIVTMMVEKTKNEVKFMPLLNEACEIGSRKAICAINRNKLFNYFEKSSKLNAYTGQS